MYFKKKISLFLSLLLSLTIAAQTRQITGKVLSEQKVPIPGVTVQVKNSEIFTTTDNAGSFAITVPAQANTVLVFTSVGYETKEVTATPGSPVEVVLSAGVEGLADVVVVGYGTQRKRDLTGSVASIAAKDVDKIPASRIDQLMQGRVSGVRVMQTNSEPGGNISIRIRGTNSINSGNEPLFVIDGFPGASDLNSINPNDIESIEILKDASATAIYGSRGANGVVIVTTKKGRTGQNNINFDTYYGIQQVAKKQELMNAREFATFLNEVQSLNNTENPSTARPLPYTQAQIDALGKGTDWQDEIFRTAPQSSYQLGFSGGNAETKYYLSLNFFEQKGIVINSGFKRGSVRFNLDRNISNKLKMGFMSQITGSSENRALVNTAGGSAGGVVLEALRINPALPLYDSTGEYTFQNGPLPYVDVTGNPVAYAQKTKDRRNNLRGLINVFGEYELLKGVKLRVSGGVDFNFATRDFYIPTDIFIATLTGNGTALKSTGTAYSWVNENTITWDKSFTDAHVINFTGGLSFQEFVDKDLTASSTNFFTNALGTDNLAIGANVQTPNSSATGNTLASYFGRINYRLLDKYLFTFTMRADGSSRFGEGNKWGYFPSGAFAWRAIDENFMKGINFLSDLKLRTSYGVTGNQEIGSYQSIARYEDNGYTLGGPNRVVGISPVNIANPNLSWESTSSFDVGLDVGIRQNRISFTADYYYKKTTDLLLQVSIPRTSGFTNVLLNAGSVENKGFEFGINTVNINKPSLRWTTNANFSTNQNKVLDLNGELERFVGASSGSLFPGQTGTTSILRLGEPIGSFYGTVFDGIWQTQEEINKSGIKSLVRPGDPRYVDQNNDSLINAADKTIIGNALPKFIWGMTNDITIGKLNINIFIQGVQGVDVLNLNRYELENGAPGSNKWKIVVNRWTGPGTSNTMPKANSTLRRSTGVTSDVVEDASYIRLKNITLSYDLPVKGIIKSANIYIAAQNLLTITNYKGYDPEVNSFGDSNLSLNTDYNAYPNTRVILAGIKLGL